MSDTTEHRLLAIREQQKKLIELETKQAAHRLLEAERDIEREQAVAEEIGGALLGGGISVQQLGQMVTVSQLRMDQCKQRAAIARSELSNVRQKLQKENTATEALRKLIAEKEEEDSIALSRVEQAGVDAITMRKWMLQVRTSND